MTKGMSIGSAQPTISDPFTGSTKTFIVPSNYVKLTVYNEMSLMVGGSRYIPPGVAEVASQPFPAQSSGQPVSDPLTGTLCEMFECCDDKWAFCLQVDQDMFLHILK